MALSIKLPPPDETVAAFLFGQPSLGEIKRKLCRPKLYIILAAAPIFSPN